MAWNSGMCVKNTRTGKIGFLVKPVPKPIRTDDPNEKFYQVALSPKKRGVFSEKDLKSFTRADSMRAIEAAKQLNSLDVLNQILEERVPDDWLVDPSGWVFLCTVWAGRTDDRGVWKRLSGRNGFYCCPVDKPRAI